MSHSTFDSSILQDTNPLELVYFQQFVGDEVPLKWWYAYGADAFPRQGTADELMNYTGPFDTESEAFHALVIEMFDHIDRLENFSLDLQTCPCFHGYALPVAHIEDANGGQS